MSTSRPKIVSVDLEIGTAEVLVANPLGLLSSELDVLAAERVDYVDLIELQDEFINVKFSVPVYRAGASLDRALMMAEIRARVQLLIPSAQSFYDEYVDQVQQWRDLHAVIEANQELANPED